MKSLKICLLLIFMSFSIVFNSHASGFRISGFVKDKQSSELLIGANILVENQRTGAVTDNNGFFSLKADFPCTLTFTYVGYSQQKIHIESMQDTLITIFLYPENELKEVVVSAKSQNKAGLTRLSARELEMIPMIGGKPDVMKAIQLLPGVLSQSEGMSLILVRGGEPGQNLYLLDNVPLIYVNHLGGFASVLIPILSTLWICIKVISLQNMAENFHQLLI